MAPDDYEIQSPRSGDTPVAGSLTSPSPPAGLQERRPSAEDLSDTAVITLLAQGRSGQTQPCSSDWQPPGIEDLGPLFPDYELLAFVGRGGMGAVFKAVQRSLGRVVALKILPPELAEGDPEFMVRFEKEARAMAALSHPHIVAVHDFGRVGSGDTPVAGSFTSPPHPPGGKSAATPLRSGDTPVAESLTSPPLTHGGRSAAAPGVAPLLYFVMEFIDGIDLAQLLKTEGPLPPQRAAAIIAQVCDALAFAHEHGIVHCDIKPSNIMIDRRGQVRVADFGLAHDLALIETGDDPLPSPGTWDSEAHGGKSATAPAALESVLMGTLAYMAPELAAGLRGDHRADLYSTGVMLHEMLAGMPPAASPQDHKSPTSTRLDRVVRKALALDPAERYQQAGDLKTDVINATSNDIPRDALISLADRLRQATVQLAAAFTDIPVLAAAIIITGGILVFHTGMRLATTTDKDLSRQSARIALLRGGMVGVRDADGRGMAITPGSHLPGGDFDLITIRFEAKPNTSLPFLTNEEITHLCRAQSLEVLSFFQARHELDESPVGAARPPGRRPALRRPAGPGCINPPPHRRAHAHPGRQAHPQARGRHPRLPHPRSGTA